MTDESKHNCCPGCEGSGYWEGLEGDIPADCPVCNSPFWTGPGYRGEYRCPHGIGHGNHVHGCDGCCSRDDFPLREKVDDPTKDSSRGLSRMGCGENLPPARVEEDDREVPDCVQGG